MKRAVIVGSGGKVSPLRLTDQQMARIMLLGAGMTWGASLVRA